MPDTGRRGSFPAATLDFYLSRTKALKII